ncbi:hypothetical protein JB92DRAFT_2896155 [Gautieria morchelliformis]|nr:hypothetical protein JB92DRAFT_2896155 [Gautieria morchelliformis]
MRESPLIYFRLMYRTSTLYNDPHNDCSSTTNTGAYHLQSSRHLPGFADARALGQAALPQRKVSRVPSRLTLSLDPPSRFSTSFEGLVSPPPSAGLKRSPHIRRKERPRRLSRVKLVSSVDINTHESQQSRQLPTPPPSGTQYAPSFISPAAPYNCNLSAPIRAHPRQENAEHTGFALPESHSCSPPSPAGAYRHPQSASIRPDARQESPERAGSAVPDSHIHSPTSLPVPYNQPLSAPIQTQVPPGRPEHPDLAIPNSPCSIYSTMTAQDPGPFDFEWDTTGYIKPESTNYPRPFDSDDTRLVPEEEGPELSRQKTAVIVELLRERRQRAGLE